MIELTPEQFALLLGTFSFMALALYLSRLQIKRLRAGAGVEDPTTPEDPKRSPGKVHPVSPWPPPPESLPNHDNPHSDWDGLSDAAQLEILTRRAVDRCPVAKDPLGEEHSWIWEYGRWERRQICASCPHRRDAHYRGRPGAKRTGCTECSCSTFEVAVGAPTNPFAVEMEAARERLAREPQ